MNGLGSDCILIWLSCEIKKWSTECIMGEVIFYLDVQDRIRRVMYGGVLNLLEEMKEADLIVKHLFREAFLQKLHCYLSFVC